MTSAAGRARSWRALPSAPEARVDAPVAGSAGRAARIAFPGNVRELENMLERAVALAPATMY